MANLPHLVRWNDELSSFGLVIVGLHVQSAPPEEIRSVAQSKGVNFAVVAGGSVQGGTDYRGIPHCMLFDHTGKCLYRGSPSSVEPPLRAAVGTAVVERAGKANFGRAVAPLAEALRKGQPPAAVLQGALSAYRSPAAATQEEAKLLIKALTASAAQQVEEAGRVMKDEPLTAYEQLRRVAVTFKGTAVGAKAETMVGELKNDKAVAAELRAQPSLEAVKKLEGLIGGKAGKDLDPKSPEFQRTFAVPLGQMRTALQQMKKSHPGARATQEATAIAGKFGVVVN